MQSRLLYFVICSLEIINLVKGVPCKVIINCSSGYYVKIKGKFKIDILGFSSTILY